MINALVWFSPDMTPIQRPARTAPASITGHIDHGRGPLITDVVHKTGVFCPFRCTKHVTSGPRPSGTPATSTATPDRDDRLQAGRLPITRQDARSGISVLIICAHQRHRCHIDTAGPGARGLSQGRGCRNHVVGAAWAQHPRGWRAVSAGAVGDDGARVTAGRAGSAGPLWLRCCGDG